MTTIAFKNGELAGDSQISDSGNVWAYMEKVWRADVGWLVGLSGRPDQIVRLRSFIDEEAITGWTPEEMNWPEDSTNDGVEALIVDLSGRVWVWNGRRNVYPVQFLEGVDAIASGSGQWIAMGAMAAGADAMRAVQIAAVLDGPTGGPIESLRL